VRGFGHQDPGTPGERRVARLAATMPVSSLTTPRQLLGAVQHADVRENPNPDAVASDYPLEQLIIFGAPRIGSYTCAHEPARTEPLLTAPPAQR
jgi:hypothetical protein